MAGVSFVSLPEATRDASGAHLLKLVYTLEDLRHQCKAAEFNVRGSPDEEGIRSLTCELESIVGMLIDSMISRARVLGIPISYSLRTVAEGSDLQPFPDDEQSGPAIVGLLGLSWRSLSALMSERAAATRSGGDPVTAHIIEHAQIDLERASARFQSMAVSQSDPGEALHELTDSPL